LSSAQWRSASTLHASFIRRTSEQDTSLERKTPAWSAGRELAYSSLYGVVPRGTPKSDFQFDASIILQFGVQTKKLVAQK